MMETTTVAIITDTEPWIHASDRSGQGAIGQTLCGRFSNDQSLFYRTEVEYLYIAEALPIHNTYVHRCGICWFKYVYGGKRLGSS